MEVVLIVELSLPLLFGHDGIVVAVIVQELLALADAPDGSDDRGVVVVMSDHIGITAVVDKA